MILVYTALMGTVSSAQFIQRSRVQSHAVSFTVGGSTPLELTSMYAVLCCAMCWAMLCQEHAVPRCVVAWCAMLCCAMLCCAILCHAVPRCQSKSASTAHSRVSVCAGVFAVILQQLNCSLGYVYVSHPLLLYLHVPLVGLLSCTYTSHVHEIACMHPILAAARVSLPDPPPRIIWG